MKRKQEHNEIMKERNKVKKYLHECVLQEGSVLEVKEDEPLLRSKIVSLTEKKFLKQSFQNFFNVRGKRVLNSEFSSLFIEVCLLKK